jgi:hypothetical protein
MIANYAFFECTYFVLFKNILTILAGIYIYFFFIFYFVFYIKHIFILFFIKKNAIIYFFMKILDSKIIVHLACLF